MKTLIDAVLEFVGLVSPKKVEAIAERIRGTSPGVPPPIDGILTTPIARETLEQLIQAWRLSGISSDMLAGLLIGGSYARRGALSEGGAELVWTGPTTPFMATRRTDQVLLDLIRSANSELFFVSFVAYDVPSIAEAIRDALKRRVEVRMLLESSEENGGTLSMDPIALMKSTIPGMQMYSWCERQGEHSGGKVHAKICVADGRDAFITSANLTGHALEKNMEAGVLIKGGDVPRSLRAHLHALIEIGTINLV